MQKIFSIFLAFILAFGLVTMPVLVKPAWAAPGTIYVSVSGDDTSGNGTAGNPYQTIQKGINVAGDGDTIMVAAGTYNEVIVLKQNWTVIIQGDGAAKTTIDGVDKNKTVITANGVYSGTKIDGFTITNGKGSPAGGGIYIQGCSPTITNCIITNNIGPNAGGIFIGFVSSPIISNCLVKDNTVTGNGGGIYASYGAPTIINCTIVDNTATNGSGGGIYHNSSSSDITNSIVYSNVNGNIDVASGSPSPSVTYSCIEGIVTSGTNIGDNPSLNPSYPSTPYHLQSGSPCIDTGDNTVWGPTDLDIDGNFRIFDGGGDPEAVVDMGVSEYLSEPPAPDDTQPPEASNPNPPDGGYTANSTPDISVNLTDNSGVDPTGVDPDSIDLWVAGANVTPDITWTDPVVYYTPPDPFEDGQVINVTVAASDFAQNAMEQYSWSFTILLYTLDVSTSGSGTVQPDTQGQSYPSGTQVTLTATAADGWSFVGWTGDIDSSDNPLTVTMDSDKTVTATFTKDKYTLTTDVDPAGGGTVNVKPAGTYHYDDIVELTAVPSDGYIFDHWSGNLTGTTNPDTITMTGNMTVTANFTQNQYTLDVNIVGNGTVARDPAPPYTYDTVVTLNATADDGWSFADWSGNLTGTTNPDTITMDDDKTVTATFTDTFNSAYTIKSVTVAMLESGKTGDKKIDKKIDKAIKHLDKSLDEKLWVDDTHLDEKHGAKVFNEEKKTIKELMHLLDKDDTPEEVKGVCQSVIDELVQADNLLANTAYNEAEAYAGDSKVDKELKKCDKEFEKAQKELDHTKKDGSPDPKYDKAIGHYKNAWKHAQKALRKAT